MKTLLYGIATCLFIGVFSQCKSSSQDYSSMLDTWMADTTKEVTEYQKETGLSATLTTSKGDIVLGLQYQLTPMTVANFVSLANGSMETTHNSGGTPFYDGLKFHRVIADFMIQGGDPLGNGSGDPGYKFPDEIVPVLKHDGAGILSMANSGPGQDGLGTNGSQFFITHKETPWLDGKHTVFGHVLQGQDIVSAIAQGDAIESVVINATTDEAKWFVAQSRMIFDKLKAHAIEKKKRAVEEEAKGMDAKYAKVDAEVAAYMAKNHPGFTKTDKGVYLYKMTEGKGPNIGVGMTVTANYVGYFMDGRVFDTSIPERAKAENIFNPERPYAPLKATMGKREVIPGMEFGMMKMNKGDKAILAIPPQLGYGPKDYGPIPGFTPLFFELEILDVK